MKYIIFVYHESISIAHVLFDLDKEAVPRSCSSVNIEKIFKEIFFAEHLPVTAPVW